MATYTELAIDQARALGRAFGLDVAAVAGIPAGSVNSNYRLTLVDGTTLFARVYEEQDSVGAESEARLLDHLAKSGVATPRPLPRCDGAGFTFALDTARIDPNPAAVRPVALFPWRDGEILCQARVTPEAARKVGEKLAEVHHAGRTFGEPKPGRFRIPDLRVRLERIGQAHDPELRAIVPELRARLDRAERERDANLPEGIIHSDLFRDNVLWQGGTLVALLDFESACTGSFAYDLMVTVLSWCYGDDFDERLVRAMFEGYAAKRPLSGAEVAALGTEARIGALRFTITRITDYTMRRGLGERVMKDYRRFWLRHERVAELGPAFCRWFS
ncbi:MAG TPA: homoserine kinase [Polyangiaceae bacterium]|nr:homoserine kinase [Polyangiaceae bacterium]